MAATVSVSQMVDASFRSFSSHRQWETRWCGTTSCWRLCNSSKTTRQKCEQRGLVRFQVRGERSAGGRYLVLMLCYPAPCRVCQAD